VAHIDQRTDVGFARGDDAVERRDQAFETFLGDQAVDVRAEAALTWAILAFRVNVRWSMSCLATASVPRERLPALCAEFAQAWHWPGRRLKWRAPA